jgi:hypothetical protein
VTTEKIPKFISIGIFNQFPALEARKIIYSGQDKIN